MKVKDLVEQLNKLDPNLEVYCYEGGPVQIAGPGPFDVLDAAVTHAELKRIDGKPEMTFGGPNEGRRFAIISITPDF